MTCQLSCSGSGRGMVFHDNMREKFLFGMKEAGEKEVCNEGEEGDRWFFLKEKSDKDGLS